MRFQNLAAVHEDSLRFEKRQTRRLLFEVEDSQRQFLKMSAQKRAVDKGVRTLLGHIDDAYDREHDSHSAEHASIERMRTLVHDPSALALELTARDEALANHVRGMKAMHEYTNQSPAIVETNAALTDL